MKPPTILVVPESEHDLVASLCVFRNGESSLSKRDQIEATAVLPTGRTKSLAWAGLGTRPEGAPGLVGLVGRALMPNVV
jgi:hypothetical protein